jgi:effector-binding domain-containing protein
LSLKEAGIIWKKTPEILVACLNFRDNYEGKKIPLMFEKLTKECGKRICGPAITLFNYGVYSDAVDIEVCFPVSEPVESDEVNCRILERVEVLSLNHHGSYDKIKESYRKLYGFFREHGIVATSFGREIALKSNYNDSEENEIEIQAVLHKWDKRFAENLNRVLGSETRKKIMEGNDRLFTLESTIDQRTQWIKTSMEKLDKLADEEEKYDILSCCAHDFSQKRISELRTIYEKSGDIDQVIDAMHQDTAWYEKPRREGNIIHARKSPYDTENYKKAKDKEEKRKNYCHCTMVRHQLKNGISPTFCYCGSGWYRQQWEGIIGKPVKIEIKKSLLKGDDSCEFTIHLPQI